MKMESGTLSKHSHLAELKSLKNHTFTRRLWESGETLTPHLGLVEALKWKCVV